MSSITIYEKNYSIYAPPFIYHVVLGYCNSRRSKVVGNISVTTPYVSS